MQKHPKLDVSGLDGKWIRSLGVFHMAVPADKDEITSNMQAHIFDPVLFNIRVGAKTETTPPYPTDLVILPIRGDTCPKSTSL